MGDAASALDRVDVGIAGARGDVLPLEAVASPADVAPCADELDVGVWSAASVA